jgi:putative Holliday junction resolvase
LLGVDFGTVRVGLAVSDADRIVASPLQTYAVQNPQVDAVALRTLAGSQGVVGIVVGLPLHTGGEEGTKAREARTFGAWLGSVTGLPVVFWDERCTTAAAEDALWGAGLSHKKRRERRDRVAAQLILQGFLDAGCPPEGTAPQPPTAPR